MDTPLTSVFVPIYAAADKIDPAYSRGTHQTFSRNSAWWAFDFVSNWMAQVNFRDMSQRYVFPLQDALQQDIDQQRASLEAGAPSVKELGKWQAGVQGAIVRRWW